MVLVRRLIDIALKTADAGYLTRRLVDVAQDVFTIDDDDRADPGFAMLRAMLKRLVLATLHVLMAVLLPKTVKGHR